MFESKLVTKWFQRNDINFFLIVLKGREQSITGSEFHNLGNLKKYELRVVLLLDGLWESLIPDSLMLDAEKDRRLGLIISKLLEGI